MDTTINVDVVDLWEAVWGSDGSGILYWCDTVRDINGSSIALWRESPSGYIVGNPQDFMLREFDESQDEYHWHKITMGDLVDAYGKALAAGERHCGVGLNVDDSDECFGDIVLQYACFGEMVYG